MGLLRSRSWSQGIGRRNGHSRAALALAGLAIVLSMFPFAADRARADSTTVMSATLPTAREYTSAVWGGTHAYVVGGANFSGKLNQIVQYEPPKDAVTTMGATLPAGRSATSAVWDGTHAYIFGGGETASNSNQIVRFSPATDTATIMTATLPSGRLFTSAVWDGQNAYIFGGNGPTPTFARLNQIVRYNPSTDTVTIMRATLPTARCCTSAVWDGTNAYIFGGWDGSVTDQIVRYNPAADTVTIMSATLPTTRSSTSAVWGGTYAYIFGGSLTCCPQPLHSNQIVRYNPATNAVAVMTPTLPTGRCCTSAVWDGKSTYIFGGWDGSDTDQIVRYTPDLPPSAPRNLGANPGPGLGQITLTWQAPASDGGTPVTNYRIYRRPATGGPYAMVATVGNVLTYVDSGLAGGIYCYRVSALNIAGEGAQSDEACSAAVASPLPLPL